MPSPSIRPALILMGAGVLSAACADGKAQAKATTGGGAQEAPPTSADYLARLPDGEDKRRFIIDCTNCHTIDATSILSGDTPRTREEWIATVQRMLGYAGAHTDFPVMTVGRDAAQTADWILRHGVHAPDIGAALTTEPAAPRMMPAGASVDEFLLPVAQELPHDVAVLDDGRVLVTGMFTNRMWLLDPARNEWSTEDIPVANSNPRAVEVTARSDGSGLDWWVLLGAPNRLARRDGRTGEWSSHALGVYGHSVTVDDRGRVWFNSHFTKDPGIIGYYDPASDEIVRFEIPTPSHLADGGTPIPYGLRIAPDGSVWSTELRGNRIVRLDPASGAVRAFDMPVTVSAPRRPDFDAAGRFWIPEYAANALTRFDPATEAFTRYPLPIRDALPYVVRVDRSRDRIWIGTAAADAAFMFDPETETFVLYPLPSRGALVRHIDIDERTGHIWLAYGAAPGIPARIARLTPTSP